MSISLGDGARLCLTWRRERLPHLLWIPVALTLSTASMLANDTHAGWELWGLRTLVAWLVLGSLRLLDDLCDVHHDRLHHPERALTQTRAHLPAWVTLCWALLLCFGLLVPAKGDLAGLAILCFFSGSFYRLDWHTHRLGPWLRLLKYPALPLILAGSLIPLPALAMVYAGVCLDELLQDTRRTPGPMRCAAAMLWLSAILWCWHWWGPLWHTTVMIVVVCAMSLMLGGVLTQATKKRTRHILRGGFLLCVLILLALPHLFLVTRSPL